MCGPQCSARVSTAGFIRGICSSNTLKNKHLTFRYMCGSKCVKNAHITRGGVFASKYVEREQRACLCLRARSVCMMNEMQERTAK